MNLLLFKIPKASQYILSSTNLTLLLDILSSLYLGKWIKDARVVEGLGNVIDLL